MSDTNQWKEQLDKASDDYAFQVPYDGTQEFYNNDKLNGFIAGANFAKEYFESENAALKERVAELQAKVNDLTMADMTHEYNDAEGERFFPELKKQIEEPFKNRIAELEQALKDQAEHYENAIGAIQNQRDDAIEEIRRSDASHNDW